MKRIKWCVQHKSVATLWEQAQDKPRCNWRRYDERQHLMPSVKTCEWEDRLLIDPKEATE